MSVQSVQGPPGENADERQPQNRQKYKNNASPQPVPEIRIKFKVIVREAIEFLLEVRECESIDI